MRHQSMVYILYYVTFPQKTKLEGQGVAGWETNKVLRNSQKGSVPKRGRWE